MLPTEKKAHSGRPVEEKKKPVALAPPPVRAASPNSPVSSPDSPAASRGRLQALGNMLFCAAGIYACFFYWGILQERIGTQAYLVDGEPKKFKFIFIIIFIQAFLSVGVSSVTLGISTWWNCRGSPSNSPVSPNPTGSGISSRRLITLIVTLTCTLTFGPQLGYVAMRHLSYPMVLTVKMCKMIPIMLVGVLWHHVKYTREKYLNVLLITLGVLGITLLYEKRGVGRSDPSLQESSIWGIALVIVNVIMDGYTNSTQDVIAKAANWGGPKLMLATNVGVVAWCGVFLFLLEVVPNDYFPAEFSSALYFLSRSPEALKDLGLMGCCNAAGQFFIFHGLTLFGSITMTALTLTRKVGSVFISIFFHGHVLAYGQWFSLLAVVVGVTWDTFINIREKKVKRH